MPGDDHQAELCSPPTEPAERASWTGQPWEGRLGAIDQGAVEGGCAGWLHSALGVPGMGHIVADLASVPLSGSLEE